MGIRLVEPDERVMQPATQQRHPGKVMIRFLIENSVMPRSFNCNSGSKYTFDSATRQTQEVRNVDAQYMLSKWPELFIQVG